MFNSLFDIEETGPTLSQCPDSIKPFVRELLQTGVTVIPASLPAELCHQIRDGFITFADKNLSIFQLYRDEHGHYPRIINLHIAYKSLLTCFDRTKRH